ncbi:hypothetical protein FRC12_008183 [Ceratobasidium sp. 428]|nr:hypothetical protein FRC12_008183 [Ceratobasidium sp. 428]
MSPPNETIVRRSWDLREFCRRTTVARGRERRDHATTMNKRWWSGGEIPQNRMHIQLDANFSTGHEWTDKEIFEQVRAELQQEEVSLRGEVVHDDDGDDDPTAADDRHAEAEPSTSHAALTSLDGLQDLLSKLNPSVFQSDLSAFESLRHKISAFDHL